MRKRFAMLTTLVVLGMTMLMPATTAASSVGVLKITDSWCTGDTIHVDFQVVKYAGHYATRFTLRATGQGSNGGKWYNAGSKSYSYTIFNPTKQAYFNKSLKFNSSYYAYSRISGVARFYDGSYLLGTAKLASGYC
jgi:hypothetical protein